MGISEQVEALENEFKLIKGELKETLASVRDYLTSFKLPPPGDAEFMKYIDGEDEQKVTMAGSISHSSDISIIEPPPSRGAAGAQAPTAADEPAGSPPVDTPGSSAAPTGATPLGVASPSGSAEGSLLTEAGLPESPAGYGGVEGVGRIRSEEMPEWAAGMRGREEEDYSAPRVNMLSNLIRWVSLAKREVGSEQLATFLEVYGVSGHLSSELKEVILHLVEITEASSEDVSSAEVWSKLILELHGILTGGDAPLHVVKPFWNDDSEEMQLEETEAQADVTPDKPEEKPLKLKLVFTNGDGKEREFGINLNPEVDRENSTGCPSNTSETN